MGLGPLLLSDKLSYMQNNKLWQTDAIRTMLPIFFLCVCTWWRHQMETFSTLLAICAGNSPVPGEFPHKGQWHGALMFSLICVWINDWVNNRETGDLWHYHAHYDITVMKYEITWWVSMYAKSLSKSSNKVGKLRSASLSPEMFACKHCQCAGTVHRVTKDVFLLYPDYCKFESRCSSNLECFGSSIEKRNKTPYAHPHIFHPPPILNLYMRHFCVQSSIL